MRRLAPLLIFALPTLLGLGLWLTSGRERFTKPGKWVLSDVPDDLFGGSNAGASWQPGPLLGYYVGLFDLVAGAAVVSALAGGTVWWLQRRRARRVGSCEGV
jgi:hypothetical protein